MDDDEKKMNEELVKIAKATIPRHYDNKKEKTNWRSVILFIIVIGVPLAFIFIWGWLNRPYTPQCNANEGCYYEHYENLRESRLRGGKQ